ncbi:MAG TPA: ATP-dependent Clp protease adaptor ClpS [Bacteroidota bacterium]|jgi:ATP-dependent Clp protease adapter protein ClpS
MTSRPLEQYEESEEVVTEEPAKVILFNDDIHSFEEVITQLMKALRCTEPHAESLALEAHTNGKAMVYTGDMVKCIEVSGILEEISLVTQIEM